MMPDSTTRRGLIMATAIGTVAQIVMVVVGHSSPAVAQMFAVGGMGISLLAGLGYTLTTPTPTASSAVLGGAIAGGVCALIGIAVSFALKDVPAFLLAAGTLSSAFTGAIGGALGRALGRKRALV
jgi:hypothetical protein